jgi:hypothetical protein
MSNYIQSVIENRGDDCGNCGAWRILKREYEFGLRSGLEGTLRIIERCSDCGDEEFDIYEVEDDGP